MSGICSLCPLAASWNLICFITYIWSLVFGRRKRLSVTYQISYRTVYGIRWNTTDDIRLDSLCIWIQLQQYETKEYTYLLKQLLKKEVPAVLFHKLWEISEACRNKQHTKERTSKWRYPLTTWAKWTRQNRRENTRWSYNYSLGWRKMWWV